MSTGRIERGAAANGRAQQSRAVEKQKSILDAAIELMFAEGLQGVTHRQVATRANVPVGSIGYYFNTRDELLQRSLESIERERSVRAAEVIDQIRDATNPTTTDMAQALAEIYLPTSDGDPLIGWVGVTLDSIRESAGLSGAVRTIRERIHADLQRLLDEVGKSQVTSGLVALVIDGAIVQAAVSDDESPRAGVVAAVTELLDVK